MIYRGRVDFFNIEFDAKVIKNHRKSIKFDRKNDRKIIDFDRKFGTPKCDILMYIYRKSECESERNKFPVTCCFVACSWLAGWLAKSG